MLAADIRNIENRRGSRLDRRFERGRDSFQHADKPLSLFIRHASSTSASHC